MILLILKVLFPLFFTILLGAYAGMKNIIPKDHSKSLVDFIILIATPSLLFSVTSTQPIEIFFNFKVIAVIVIGLLLTYLKTYSIYHYKLKKHPKESSQASLISAFPNAAFMGIPIILSLYGQEALAVVVIGSLAVFLIITPLTMFLVDYHDSNDKLHLKDIALKMLNLLKSPLIFAPIIGVIISFLHIKIPDFLSSGFKFIGDTAPALSLFATGLFISYTRITMTIEVALLILIRNVISPFIFFILMKIVGISGNLFNEIILVSAMPTASTAPMFSSKFETYEAETSAATILGTLFSILTIGGIIFLTN